MLIVSGEASGLGKYTGIRATFLNAGDVSGRYLSGSGPYRKDVDRGAMKIGDTG